MGHSVLKNRVITFILNIALVTLTRRVVTVSKL